MAVRKIAANTLNITTIGVGFSRYRNTGTNNPTVVASEIKRTGQALLENSIMIGELYRYASYVEYYLYGKI